ncbi:MAG: DNA polymerase I, partial [Bacteroidia bacterium]
MTTPNRRPRLFLLDAMALIFRAYFAFAQNPRYNSKGLNTSAAFGFALALLDLLQKERPHHIGVAFDTAEPTFRHKEFEAYKAQRDAMPEDLAAALPYIDRLIEAFRIPILRLPGFEADDIIGTLAHRAADAGFEVFMFSQDKDFGQLVRPFVHIYKPAKGGQGVEILGVDEICAKWEIQRPSQVIDILGLWGDASDNIPGVPGVGEKTAKKLIAEYGSMDELLLRTAELKGKVRENLEGFREQALLSRRLATIDTEVPLPFEPDKLLWEPYNREALTELFEELEFRTLTRRVLDHPTAFVPPGFEAHTTHTAAPNALNAAAGPGSPNPAGQAAAAAPIAAVADLFEATPTAHAVRTYADGGKTYTLVQTEPEYRALLATLQGQSVWAFDTETNGLDPLEAGMVGFSVAWEDDSAVFVRLPDETQACKTWLELLRPLICDPGRTLIGHNLKFDLQVLAGYGLYPQGSLRDTMLAHYLLDPDGKHGLDMLSEQYLHYRPIPIEELIGIKETKGNKTPQKNMRDVPNDVLAIYAAEDADITRLLYAVLEPELEKLGQKDLFETVDCPLVPVLAAMEREGIRLDTKVLKEFSGSLEADLKRLEKSIHSLAGVDFNIASPKQLGEVLFEKLKLDPKAKKTKTGQYKTDEEVLSALEFQSPVVAQVLEYREALKLRSTYAEALPELIRPWSGRIHTSYHQHVTATGRLSSQSPNLQNIPIRTPKGREIRKAFVAREEEGWVLLSADYSQIELRLMAAFSKDVSMLEAFRKGRDIHATTAAKIFKVPLEEVTSDMRRKAKTANFGIIYGISAFGLAQRLAIPRSEAKEIIDAYFKEFPAVKEYMDGAIEKARKFEYVETVLGRRRYLRDINSRNMTMRGFAERNAINAPLQGSAADLIKVAMIHVYDWMKKDKLQSKMILQVHDELVFDAHRDELELLKKHVPELMSQAIQLPVPIEVEVGVGLD